MATRRYLIVIESGPNNYSAFVPDVDGVIATGATVEEVTRTMQEALEFHLGSLRGEPLPQPTCSAGCVEVDVPDTLFTADDKARTS